MKDYRFLLFDADNTLLDFFKSEENALALALSEQGIRVTPALSKSYSDINDGLWKDLEKKLITKERLRVKRFEDFDRKENLHADVAKLSKNYTDFLSTQAIEADGAFELLSALCGKYEIYVITNGIGYVQKGRMAKTRLFPLIKESFISEEIGFEKPDVRYFDAIAKKIPGFDPEKALVIGDSLTSDVLGGINAGIDTCLLKTPHTAPHPEIVPTYTIGALSELFEILKN